MHSLPIKTLIVLWIRFNIRMINPQKVKSESKMSNLEFEFIPLSVPQPEPEQDRAGTLRASTRIPLL